MVGIYTQSKCVDCGKEISIRANYCKPCSYKHGWEHRDKAIKIKRICKNCYGEFTIKKNEIEKGCGIFCSMKCLYSFRKGKKYEDIMGIDKSILTRIKISEAKLKEKNPMWKDDKVGYSSLHAWIKRNKPKPIWCELCFLRKPEDLANISGKYKRDINDFKWICRKCHMIEDGRLKRLIQIRPKNNLRDSKGRYTK